MRRTLLAIVLVAGCYQPSAELPCTVTCGIGNTCPGALTCDTTDNRCKRDGSCDTNPIDARPNDAVDAPSDELGNFCFGHDDVLPKICVTSVDPGVLMPGATINTNSDSRCVNVTLASGDVCVLAFAAVVIPDGTTLRAEGTKPLVLIGASLINIDGRIDVSSSFPSNNGPGAGANYSGCGISGAPTNLGGGGGGSFIRSGSPGGNGDGQVMGAGLSNPITTTLKVRGGCSGGTGQGGTAPPGGAGGGAVYLLTSGNLTLGSTGSINASGAGGPGGGNSGGGNGGGSGGLIAIDAGAIIDIGGGFLLANGGGGGCGGGGPTFGDPGTNPSHGSDPNGCQSNSMSGGDGGYFDIDATSGAQGAPAGGGGGGGGALGVIFLRPASVILDRSPSTSAQ